MPAKVQYMPDGQVGKMWQKHEVAQCRAVSLANDTGVQAERLPHKIASSK